MSIVNCKSDIPHPVAKSAFKISSGSDRSSCRQANIWDGMSWKHFGTERWPWRVHSKRPLFWTLALFASITSTTTATYGSWLPLAKAWLVKFENSKGIKLDVGNRNSLQWMNVGQCWGFYLKVVNFSLFSHHICQETHSPWNGSMFPSVSWKVAKVPMKPGWRLNLSNKVPVNVAYTYCGYSMTFCSAWVFLHLGGPLLLWCLQQGRMLSKGLSYHLLLGHFLSTTCCLHESTFGHGWYPKLGPGRSDRKHWDFEFRLLPLQLSVAHKGCRFNFAWQFIQDVGLPT